MTDQATSHPLLTSLWLALCVTALAGVQGFIIALAVRGCSHRVRSLAMVGTLIVFLLPSFWVTDTWMWLLGHRGVLKSILPFSIYSFPGAVWVMSLTLWPLTAAAFWIGWRRVGREHWDSWIHLRPMSVLIHLLLAPAWSTVRIGLLITFVLAWNQVAIPSFLQVHVLPVEVWVYFSSTYDTKRALLHAAPMIVINLLLVLILIRFSRIPWPEHIGTDWSSQLRVRVSNLWHAAIIIGSVLYILSFIPVFMGCAAFPTQFQALIQAWRAGAHAIFSSILLASLGTLTACGFGLLAVRSVLLRAVLALCWLMPGIFLGLVFLLIAHLLGRPQLAQSVAGSTVLLAIRYAIVPTLAFAAARERVQPALHDLARWLQFSRWQRLIHVVVPTGLGLFSGAAYLVFLLCLWEIETLLLCLPAGWQTVSHRIFSLLHYGHDEQVSALCMILFAIGVAPGLIALALFGSFIKLRERRVRRLMRTGAFLIIAAALLTTGCAPPGSGKDTALNSRLFLKVEVLGQPGRGPGQFIKPRSVAVDTQGRIYVLDFTGRLQAFDQHGTFLWAYQFQEIQLGKPKGMTVDPQGRIIVTEPHYSRVDVFDASGHLIKRWGVKGTGPGQLFFPRDVAVNRFGEIYISEYGPVDRVQRFIQDGAVYLNQFGTHGDGPGEMNRPEGLCIGPDHTLFVADSCNHRIQIWSRDGRFIRQFGRAGSGLGELSYPYDVVVDPWGYVIVCEFGNSRVQVFDLQGNPIEIIGGPGTAPGQFSNPWHIACDAAGNVYVADGGNDRVQILRRLKKKIGEG